MSNENDQDQLLEHPEWLVLSETSVREGRVRVAVDGGGALFGFATYLVGDAVPIGDGVAELEDLFVDPQWRRQRIAEGLVLDISAQLITRGSKALDRQPARHGVLRHMGFVATFGSSGPDREF